MDMNMLVTVEIKYHQVIILWATSPTPHPPPPLYFPLSPFPPLFLLLLSPLLFLLKHCYPLWTLAFNTFHHSFSSLVTVCHFLIPSIFRPWLSIHSTIHSHLWSLYAIFLFLVSAARWGQMPSFQKCLGSCFQIHGFSVLAQCSSCRIVVVHKDSREDGK